MKKILFFLIFFYGTYSYGQTTNNKENILYVVDSIPIYEEPAKDNNFLKQDDIAEIKVIKNKVELDQLGYSKFDGVIFILTKEYQKRPAELKSIPTTKTMKRQGKVFYLKGSDKPYTGRFIDYYITGKIEGEGFFQEGLIDGLRTKYHPNGLKSVERNYVKGLANGLSKEFFLDGTVRQKGRFVDNLEEGVWEMYYPNGQLKQSSSFSKGKMNGDVSIYYSSGILKVKVFQRNGKEVLDGKFKKINNLYKKGLQNDRIGNYKLAIKQYSKCITIDSTFVDAYFARGTSKLNNFQFDDAKKDFDKVLEIEPYFEKAYGNRAFCIIRKYQIGDSRVISKSDGVTISASKDNVSIPEAELNIVCEDLSRAKSLGVKSKMIDDAILEFCKE